ncbi:MAG TPA: bifunctional pyr operon transcriptional regulator/uracil phosphoribosyltransferase PyrR [Candidatus Dormibacteraeota bacterium]|jgi:pyrimidine operon attenuation protein/uracil phosphoribosyltransferase|nr:bifunctional pyr operon transcriptional regulator/uracil phosphoribosyltransferase PyrR [Candidatus Dormibacteraeota bacterium]
MSGAPQSLEGRPRLLDEMAVARAVLRLAHEIAERHEGEQIVLAGIRTRGVPLARRVARALAALGQPHPTVVSLDLRDYRDDRPRPMRPRPGALGATEGSTAPRIDGRVVVLVDDVLFTGRTLRAALDALIEQGRPATVEVLVLIDRGHRELPMRATYVGKNVPTAPSERVAVRLREIDGVDGAWVIEGVEA